MVPLPRILIIEDDKEHLEFLMAAFGRQLRIPEPEKVLRWAETRDEAIRRLTFEAYHIVSIDQNLPIIEGGPTRSDHGVELIGYRSTQTLADWWVYTGFGTVGLSNKFGLNDISYREKSMTPGEDRRLWDEYATEVLHNWEEKYFPNAFARCAQCLSPFLAEPCGRAANALQTSDWPAFFKAVGLIRENIVLLLCGVTCAILSAPEPVPQPKRFKSSLQPADAVAYESWLARQWAQVPYPLRRFLCPASNGKAFSEAEERAFFVAMAKLRDLRNAVEHDRKIEYTQQDFQTHRADLLCLIDALGFFCRFPLMHGVRFHPNRRGLLEYARIGPSGMPVLDTWDVEVMPPIKPDDAALHIVWQKANSTELRPLQPAFRARRDDRGRLSFVLDLGAGEMKL